MSKQVRINDNLIVHKDFFDFGQAQWTDIGFWFYSHDAANIGIVLNKASQKLSYWITRGEKMDK